jgi:anti-sigma regulatory factor (Ser/Thr protein kinase)
VIQIVRLLDEALTNAVKHANARRVTVRIETLAVLTSLDRGCITVEDDGRVLTSPRRTDPPGGESSARLAQHAKPRGALRRGAGAGLLRPRDTRTREG